MIRKLFLFTFILALFLLQGCGEKSAAEYFTQAQSAVESGDNETALIELKNVLRIEPRHAEARFMLGQVYLESNDWPSAQKELERALEFNYPAEEVVPLIASVYQKMGANSELLKLDLKAKGIKKSDLVRIKYFQVKAYLESQAEEKAQTVIDEIKQVKTTTPYKALTSYLELRLNKQNDAALLQLDAIIKDFPNNSEALKMMAMEKLTRREVESGIEFLTRYIEVEPTDYEYQFILAQLYIDNQQFKEAEPVVDKLMAINESQPYLNQLKALIKYSEGKFDEALSFAETAIIGAPEDITVRLIAGTAAFALKQYETAHQHLVLIASQLPDDHRALRLLAQSQLSLGQAAEANETAQRFLEIDSQDAEFLANLAGTLSKTGEKKKANKLLAKADSQELSGIALSKKGFVKLTLNDVSGILDLEKSIEQTDMEGQTKQEVQSLLVTAYLRSGDYDKASAITSQWLSVGENEYQAYMTQGIIAHQQKQFDEAIKNYKKAEEINPDAVEPKLSIVESNYLKNPQDGKAVLSQLDAILADHPTSVPVILKRYSLAKKLQQKNTTVEHLEGLRQQDTALPIHLAILGKMYFLEQNMAKAIELFEGLGMDNPAPYWRTLADAYIKEKRVEDAISLYRKWVELSPNSPVAIFGMARIHDLRGEYKKALELTSRFVDELGGTDLRIRLFNIQMLIKNNKPEVAETQLAALSESELSLPYATGLKGQLQLRDKNYAEAKANMLVAYKARPSTELANLLTRVEMVTNGRDAARQFLANHIEKMPQDEFNLMQYASLQIMENKASSIPTYRQVLSFSPNNMVALNNLAFVLMEEGQLAEARKLAEKALSLQPDNPSVMDTLATIARLSNDLTRAEGLLAKAVDSFNDKVDETILVNYIEVLLMNSKTALAERQISRHEIKSEAESARLAALKKQYQI